VVAHVDQSLHWGFLGAATVFTQRSLFSTWGLPRRQELWFPGGLFPGTKLFWRTCSLFPNQPLLGLELAGCL